jgi:hypothetical protein
LEFKLAIRTRKKISKKSKTKKQLFYDSKWKSEQAKKAGLKNTEKQKAARKKVGTILGLKHGSKNGLKSQRRQFGYIKIKIRPLSYQLNYKNPFLL